MVDHLDDRRHPPAFLAEQPAPGAVQLQLAGGVRAVAELVLEPHQVHPVALTVGCEAGNDEAGESTGGLGEDQEHVAHRRREEPLVAVELVLGPGAASVQRPRRRRIRAHVGSALLLGHPHRAGRAALVGSGDRAMVVDRRAQPWLPLACDLGYRAERGDRRIGASDRAADPAVGLGHADEARRSGDVCPRAGLSPGTGVEAVADGDRHQLVVGGVEVDLVDPVARSGRGSAGVGGWRFACSPKWADVGAADDPPERAQLGAGVVAALALDRLDQGPVGGEDVVVLQRRRLVRRPRRLQIAVDRRPLRHRFRA